MPNGGGGIGEFINTFFQAEQLKNQRRQLEMLESNSLAQRTNLATNLASLIVDPDARQALEFVVGGDEILQANIAEILEHVAPGANVMQRVAAMQGLRRAEESDVEGMEDIALRREITEMLPSQLRQEEIMQLISAGDATDEELADLARTLRARLVGQTPGALARDITVADLSPEELTAFERITGGLQLSEFERNQISNWAAQNGIQWRELAQRGALGVAELAIRWRTAQMQSDAAMARGERGEMPSPNTLITTMNQSLMALKDKKLTEPEQQNLVTVFNAAADNLTQMALYPPGVRLPTDLKELNPTIIDKVKKFFDQFNPRRGDTEFLEQQEVTAEQLLEALRRLGIINDEEEETP